MADVRCIDCEVFHCEKEDVETTPEFCPRRNAADALARADKIRSTDGAVKGVMAAAKHVETTGYRQWPRVRELIEFAKAMGVRKLGIAFCGGLREETTVLVRVLESHGFDVSSVACSVAGGCNPVGQALTLASAETELNVVMGLCMGHDALFNQHSQAPTTTLVVKDRVTCHNTVAPLVCRYWRNTLFHKEGDGE